MAGVRRLLQRSLPDLWVALLAALLCLPVLRHAGYGLSGDLVFSPRQPLTLETVGLGSRLPRAVPLDAVLGLVGVVVPGQVLFRVAVLAGLVLAGSGAHRLAARSGCGPLPRVVAAGFAVWNPYVVERLALGQWALVLAYGALAWVVLGVLRWHEDARAVPWSVWAWVGLASLTPTGGLLATALAVSLGARRRSRALLLAAGCCVLQLPWVLPSVLATASMSGDPGGVAAFRAGPDAPGGALISLLGLGGIWDHESVPSSRGSLLGVLAAVVVVVVLVGAWARLPAEGRRLVLVGSLGLLLGLAPRVPGVDEVVRAVVVQVPGGGLLRDSQKWLAPLVLATAWAAAITVDRLGRAAGRLDPGLAPVPVVVAVLLPLVLLPDAASTVSSAVRPVDYPHDFARVRDHLEHAPGKGGGAMVLLPWRAYRVFDWGGSRTAADPAWAWFDVPMRGSSELVVGRRRVDRDLATSSFGGVADRPGTAERLAARGVRWALVYTDDPATPDLDVSDLDLVVPGHDLRLYRVPGDVAAPVGVPVPRRVLVVAVDLAVLLGWLGAWVAVAFRCARRSPDNVRRGGARRRAGPTGG